MRNQSMNRAQKRLLTGTAVLAVAAIAALFVAEPVRADDDAKASSRHGFVKPAVVTVNPIASLIEGADPAAPISGAATITRTRRSVGFNYVTADLEPGAPYTMWWVTFNRPRKCIEPYKCGLADLSDPRVDAGVFFAGGRVADAYGQAVFAGEINYGELPSGEDQVPFPGIEAPLKPGAEIHLVVRAHGPALDDPAALKAQLTQFNGGCPPNDGCVDVQVSVHPSPYARKRIYR